jgi:hypothetical protein
MTARQPSAPESAARCWGVVAFGHHDAAYWFRIINAMVALPTDDDDDAAWMWLRESRVDNNA